MADLQIDYDKLHELANSARTLKSHLDDQVPGLGDARGSAAIYAGSSQIGSTRLWGSLNRFERAWDTPFEDAMSKLDELAQMLDSVATTFFDMDADLAGKASQSLSSLKNNDWESRNAEYQHYLANKDKEFTYQYRDEHGDLVTGTRPLVDWSDPSNPPPADPGARPTSSSLAGTDTHSQYDDSGRLISDETGVSSDSGLSYRESTTYSYDGDSTEPNGYTTDITHADGTTDRLVQRVTGDGSYTLTHTTPEGSTTSVVTPTAAPDGSATGYRSVTTSSDGSVTETVVQNNPDGAPDTKVVTAPNSVTTYTGNSDYGQWTEVSDDTAATEGNKTGPVSASDQLGPTPGGSRPTIN